MNDNMTPRQQNALFLSRPSRAMPTGKYGHLTLFQKKMLSYVGAGLCFLSELIHLYLLPQQYDIFLVYGLIFLLIAIAQGIVGANLLFEARRRLLSFGLWVNVLIVVLYIFTHTIGVVVGLAFLPLPIDAWGVGATIAEVGVVVILLFLRRDSLASGGGRSKKELGVNIHDRINTRE